MKGGRNRVREALRALRRRPSMLAGALLVGLPALLAAAAPLLPLASPDATDLKARLLPPLAEGHLLGTDHLGRDLLARLVHGTGVSLLVALLGTVAAACVGTLVGLLAGYYRRFLDVFLMRGIDVLMAFPYLLLALAVVAVLGPGLRNAVIAMAVVNVPFFARTVRGTCLGLTRLDFVAAARGSGLSDRRILLGELLPHVLPVAGVAVATTLGWMILETAGLSFLGLGAQPPQADLGGMLGQGRHLLGTAPHVAVIPGAAILILVVGLNLVADGLRDLLDPRHVPAAARARRQQDAQADGGGRRDAGALLEVAGLRVVFPDRDTELVALRGLDLHVRKGEAVGLVGESGSGKSVTCLAVLGLVPEPGFVAAGSVSVLGERLTGAPPEVVRSLRRRALGFVPQDASTALDPLFPAGEQVEEGMRAQGMDAEAARHRARQLLGDVRIPDPARCAASYPHELSGGMRQRVLVAAALANEPRLLLADEPTTALDVTTQAQVLKLLAQQRERRGSALLFVSHDLGVVSQVCERVVVLYSGEVMEEAPAGELFHHPLHPYTQQLLASIPGRKRQQGALRGPETRPPAAEGCVFAARCHLAEEACREAPVVLEELRPGHRVRCIKGEPGES